MADRPREEFRHADHEDRFILVGNLVFAVVRNSGIAFFALALLAVPLLLAVMLLPFVRAGLAHVPDELVVGGYLGLAIPITAWLTWVRVQRLRRNRFAVDAQGIWWLWYPRSPRSIAWHEIAHIYDSDDPDDPDSGNDLVFVGTGRPIHFESEDWPLWRMRQAVRRYRPILTLAEYHAATGKR